MGIEGFESKGQERLAGVEEGGGGLVRMYGNIWVI